MITCMGHVSDDAQVLLIGGLHRSERGVVCVSVLMMDVLSVTRVGSDCEYLIAYTFSVLARAPSRLSYQWYAYQPPRAFGRLS